MKRLFLAFCLINICNLTSAQYHVRGKFPRHAKELRLDEAHLDSSHYIVHADEAWKGLQLPQAFSGDGVLIGITDIGFDFTHPNYANTHFVRFWDMLSRDTLNSKRPVLTGRDYDASEINLLQHSYDGCDHTHGTFTMGCAVGGSTSYPGIAPDADVVVIGGVLSNNASMVDSLQKKKLEVNYKFDEFSYIFDYAEQVGKPCVINMSAGSRQSFGDEFDVYNQRINELVGPGRIIVASAGNNGLQYTTLHKPSSALSVGSELVFTSAQGYLFFQGEESTFCQILCLNENNNDKYPLPQELYERIDTVSDYDGSPVQYIILSREKIRSAGYQRLFASLTGEGQATLYTQGILYNNSGAEDGFNDASREGSVNFPACYDNVICVGSTHHRDTRTNYLGEPITWHSQPDTNLGSICPFSSLGPRIDGYQKPDICAPGCMVASSVSSYYEEKLQSGIVDDVERFQHNNRTYSWRADCGTSISSPIVAGIIALWLQANPNLTPQDIKDIFRRTARHPDPSLSYPNPIYGYGEIDAYAGLLDIVAGTSIPNVSTYQPQSVRFQLQGNNLLLHLSEVATHLHLYIYNTSGMKVHESYISSAQGSISESLPALPSGVYILQLRADQPSVTGSTLLRITSR